MSIRDFLEHFKHLDEDNLDKEIIFQDAENQDKMLFHGSLLCSDVFKLLFLKVKNDN